MLSYEKTLKLKKDLSNLPLIALIGANALPIVGVIAWDWDAFSIVLLYWAENLVIGFYNVLKMAFSRVPHPSMHFGKLLMIPFFIVHYGGFVGGHGFFILMLFREKTVDPFPGAADSWPCIFIFLQLLLNVIGEMIQILPANMLYAIAGLVISHGISLGYHYFDQGEFRQRSLQQLMVEPYGRIVVMHIAIIAGAFLTMSIGSPVGVLIMLVLLKTIFDIKLHLREHREKDKSHA